MVATQFVNMFYLSIVFALHLLKTRYKKHIESHVLRFDDVYKDGCERLPTDHCPNPDIITQGIDPNSRQPAMG